MYVTLITDTNAQAQCSGQLILATTLLPFLNAVEHG
jgi:hypothetical protein